MERARRLELTAEQEPGTDTWVLRSYVAAGEDSYQSLQRVSGEYVEMEGFAVVVGRFLAEAERSARERAKGG